MTKENGAKAEFVRLMLDTAEILSASTEVVKEKVRKLERVERKLERVERMIEGLEKLIKEEEARSRKDEYDQGRIAGYRVCQKRLIQILQEED